MDTDPDDPVAGYAPYSFVPAGHSGPANMSMSRDFGRREAVASIPAMDSVLDGHGRLPGPLDRRDVTFAFRAFTDGDNDAAYDLLAAQVAPGYPQRLVYRTDSGALWFTVGSNPRIRHTLTAASSWGAGGYCDFEVTWRVRPDWRPRFSETSDVWGYNDGVWGAADGVWGGLYTVPLPLATVTFSLDATGTAGSNLPTIPDTGPVVTITGPFGGAAGILLINGAVPVRRPDGVLDVLRLTLPYALADANQQYVIDCARQRFTYNGVPFRPTRPAYQPWWFAVMPGVVNSCQVIGQGASPLGGGSLLLDWWRKRV